MTFNTSIPQLSTASEARDALHVNQSGLDALVAAGQVPAYNFGEEGIRYHVTSMTQPFPTLLLPEEVMDTLHVDEQTLSDMVSAGQLPVYHVTSENLPRFFPDDVQAAQRAAFVALFDPCGIY